MSIQSEINRLKQAVSDAFTAIGNKGGTVPSSKVSGNLATAINSIPEGVELNFEVVGGTTQPSPKENIIWVNTNTITDWVFSATQPTALPGRVWISIGVESAVEFNALKENEIRVYPISAQQYVNGTWVNVEVQSYQNGEWVEWDTKKYVFKSGFGFNSKVYKKLESNSNIKVTSYTVLNYSVNSGNASIALNSYANGNDICPLAFDIDLSKYKTMYIDASVSKSNGSSAELALYVANEGTTSISNFSTTTFKPSSDGTRKPYTYPVENINATKRIMLSVWNGRKSTIHNIWFE